MALDTSIPGSATLDDWPTPPVPPLRIINEDGYREGDAQRYSTRFIELKDSAGTIYHFFFDKFLGRLCYGTHHEDDDAAFIRKGSKLEREAFAAIEAAITPEYRHVANQLAIAKRWKGEAS